MMNGWKTAILPGLELEALHKRQMESLRKGMRGQYGRDDISSYYQGGHPIYALSSSFYRMTGQPLLIAGVYRLGGYLCAWATKAPRCEDEKLVRFVRSWQLRKIRSEVLSKIRFSSSGDQQKVSKETGS